MWDWRYIFLQTHLCDDEPYLALDLAQRKSLHDDSKHTLRLSLLGQNAIDIVSYNPEAQTEDIGHDVSGRHNFDDNSQCRVHTAGDPETGEV